ncbi:MULTISPECIES: hypothetical protein [Streptomyces]|uniref:hypothetical protein n=1 Tax=Streptomyces TaxID=1883 RepID=UPI0018DFB1FA|nr:MULTISPECIES: hypothetical protein [Streptomyces]MCZ4095341.1 hypothetical protein [Streptomyces sp. H39-C1]
MADGIADGSRDADGSGGAERTELRISVTGTHNRHLDLEALQEWLDTSSSLKEARDRGEFTVVRRASRDQRDSMAGEILQDIILVVVAEAVRPVAESAWRSVLTWVRNRRRLADRREEPRVTLDGGDLGPGREIRLDSDQNPDTSGATDEVEEA